MLIPLGLKNRFLIAVKPKRVNVGIIETNLMHVNRQQQNR